MKRIKKYKLHRNIEGIPLICNGQYERVLPLQVYFTRCQVGHHAFEYFGWCFRIPMRKQDDQFERGKKRKK